MSKTKNEEFQRLTAAGLPIIAPWILIGFLYNRTAFSVSANDSQCMYPLAAAGDKFSIIPPARM